MLRSTAAAVLAVYSLAALGTEKNDAELTLQQLNPPAPVCYSLKIIRPIGAPESDGKPRFMPLELTLKNGVGNDISTSCAGPGAVLKAAGFPAGDDAPKPEQPAKISPALVPALKSVQDAVKAKDFPLAAKELAKAEATPNKSEFDEHVIGQFRRMIDARLNRPAR